MYNENELYQTSDLMICAMAKLLQNEKTVFHGVSSHMPMIAILLAKKLGASQLVHLNIPGGVDPNPVHIKSYTSAGKELVDRSFANFPLQEVFDLSMRGGLDVAFLSGIQFDKHGNVNASVIGSYHQPKVRMPGGAGSAVLIPTAKRAILWRTKHDTRTFVENVDFVTTCGNVDRIVTPLCIFKMTNGRLLIESIHPGVSLDDVQKNSGFPLEYEIIKITEPPTDQELRLLKQIDPHNFRNIEFKNQ